MRKYKLLLGAAAAVIVAGAAWYLFRPELLFVNARVAEALPAAATDAAAAQPVKLASGEFHPVNHASKGAAAIYQLADGRRVLRFTDFETSNGPALHVYLVAAKDALDSKTVRDADTIDLGDLKGNVGDQNYDVQPGIDLANFGAVSIWCKRFSVNFATAPLMPAR
jgi:hypothetical protein